MRGELADIRAEMDEFVKSLLKAQAQAQARAHRQFGDVDIGDLQRQVSCPSACPSGHSFLPSKLELAPNRTPCVVVPIVIARRFGSCRRRRSVCRPKT